MLLWAVWPPCPAEHQTPVPFSSLFFPAQTLKALDPEQILTKFAPLKAVYRDNLYLYSRHFGYNVLHRVTLCNHMLPLVTL